MKKVNLDEIKSFYNSVPEVWSDNDAWHMHSRERISTYISQNDFWSNTNIINAGSGGSDYNLKYGHMLHVDIAETKIKQYDDFLVANVENLPLDSNTFDNAICVGSVLNYCDPVSAISELCRVLKSGGHLVLEYESSWGFEYIGQDIYKQDAVVASIEYLNVQQNQWLFSPQYIKNILRTYNFIIEKEYKFHILDGIVSKFLNDKSSVIFSQKFDWIACKLPYLRKHANNIMYICKKL